MKDVRKTKIICTLGPSTDSTEMIEKLVLAGMDAARMNFSHGTHEEHKVRLEKIDEVCSRLHIPVATILDTKGPEIRLGDFKDGKVTLKEGQRFTLTTEEIEGDEEMVSISYDGLPKDVSQGSHVLIDDGLIDMVVEEVDDTHVVCTVLNGGPVSNHKGVNVPDADLKIPFISKKDLSDLVFGAENGFDYVAASFTRSAQDILDVRRTLDAHGGKDMGIIAKIENMQGVNNIDEIIAVADGVMVARGDLGVEVPMEEVPIIQKDIIKKCYSNAKLVITATQMLDSMIQNPRPTRAEVADVANAVFDGTSAIMLSGETASGAYPIEAVEVMSRIALRTENSISYDKRLRNTQIGKDPDITTAICHATCTTAMDLNAEAIITVTESGFTARQLSRFRPQNRIIAFSTSDINCRRLNLSWGVKPVFLEDIDDMEELIVVAAREAKKEGLVEDGDLLVLTAGMPLGVSGNTNLLRVHVVN